MTSAGTMSAILSSLTLTNNDLDIIRLYLRDVRDGAVSGTTTFGSTVSGVAGATRDFTITNEREENATFLTAPQGSNGEFAVVAGGTCSGATVLGVGGSCTVRMQFTPAGIGGRTGSLIFRINNRVGVTSQQVTLSLSGTGLDPTPVYTANNFGTLSAPGFQAPITGSQTLCPTISNGAPVGGNNLQVALSAAQSGGTDYTGYYEIDALANCPVFTAGPRCTAVATGSAIGGGATVAPGASCTLPIKFNPSKFGFGGGTGARNATLTVTHNSPTAGTTAQYTLQGIVATTPRIGVTTSPSATGSGSSAKVSPPAFASQVVATTSALWNDFTISNVGTADGLDITAVTNSNPTEFALTENCVAAPPLARLSGGAPTCTIGLTFTPLAAPGGLGERCTTVTIQAVESSNGDQSVKVCGTGVPVPVPQMDVSRTAIPFGNRAIGAIYLPEPLVITNRASATLALQIGAVAINGAGFAFVPDASSCQSQTLAAGASCTLQVQFTPTQSTVDTPSSGTLTLASNDPTTPNLVVTLSATARAFSVPVLQWPAGTTTLAFTDPVAAGQQSAQVFTRRLTNAGPGAVDVQAVRLIGADAANFTLTSCPTTLFDSEFCDVTLRFTPGSGGQKTAQIEVVTGTGSAPPLIAVQGLGAGGSSSFLTVSSTALTFGGVRVGARSDPLALRLTAGDGVLTITSISADAPFSVVSQTCPPPPFLLRPGSDCSIGVIFTPASTSDVSGKLRVATDAGGPPTEVSLDGVGQDQANVSGGGCTMIEGESATADPMLWLLILLASAVLAHRRGDRKPEDHKKQEENQP